jgi:hypothetical protein
MMKKVLQMVAAVPFAIGLIACGGGSGGGSNTMTGPQNFNLQAGVANMVTHGLQSNVSLSGSVMVNGNSTSFTGSGTYTLAPGVSGTFNGTAASSQAETISGTINVAGQSGPLTVNVTDYYATSNSALLGEVESTEYDVAQASIDYPTSIQGGSSGTLGTILRYTDSTMSVSLGTVQLTYAATAPTTQGGPITIAVTVKIYDTHNALTETDVRNYTLTPSNVISFVSASAQKQQGSLTVTAQ